MCVYIYIYICERLGFGRLEPRSLLVRIMLRQIVLLPVEVRCYMFV